MKSLRCRIPKNAPAFISITSCQKDADKLRALIQYIVYIQDYQNRETNKKFGYDWQSGWCPISSKALRSIIHNYTRIIHIAESHGIIEFKKNADGDKMYTPGQFSALVRFKNHDKKFRWETITTTSVIKSFKRHFNTKYEKQVEILLRSSKYYRECLNFIHELKLESGDESVNEEEFGAFNNGLNRFLVRDEYGHRIHTHISSLKKEHRKLLKLRNSNEKLLYIDVKNSQPFILALMFCFPTIIERAAPELVMIKKIIQRTLKTDSLFQFLEDTRQGRFYTLLIQQFNLNKQELKEMLFENIFYCSYFKGEKGSEAFKIRHKARLIFGEKYPTVLNLLDELKHLHVKDFPFIQEMNNSRKKPIKGYSIINMLCQRVESYLLLDVFTRELCKSKVGVATIHDAWILRQKDLVKFKEIFHQVFCKLGVPEPQLDVTYLKDLKD